MNDDLDGKKFGGALEELRRAARINLPRLADEYHEALKHIQDASKYESRFTPAHFACDGRSFQSAWEQMYQMVEFGIGTTMNNYWEVADVLDTALESFIEQDSAAAEELEKQKLETDKMDGGEGWSDEYTGERPTYEP